jgi:hypothetical protein
MKATKSWGPDDIGRVGDEKQSASHGDEGLFDHSLRNHEDYRVLASVGR